MNKDRIFEENLTVEILRIDFLRKEGEVAQICKALADHDDERVLRNKIINTLVNRIWQLTYFEIIKYVLIPYLTCFLSFISYTLVFLQLENSEEGNIKERKI